METLPTAIQPIESVPMDIQTTVQADISEDTRQKSFADTTLVNNLKEDPSEIIILNEGRPRPPPPFQCLICFTFFSDPVILNKHVVESHIASVHEKNKPFLVENRGFIGSDMTQIRNKILPITVQPIGSVPLDIQTKNLTANSEVARKPFADTTQLNNFKRRKAPFQNYFECKACSKSYSNVENMKKHIESVHEMKMTHHDVAKSHVAPVHDKKKPHKCEAILENSQICGYVFNQKDDMINHLILAHGFIKP